MSDVLIIEVGPLDRPHGMGRTKACRPRAPGASGKVVTEDLVFRSEALGVPTGLPKGFAHG